MKIVHKRTFTYLKLIIFLSLISWQSCTVMRSNTSSLNGDGIIGITPEIIYLNYSVKPDKLNGTLQILLINKVVSEGRLKGNNARQEIPKPGDLNCITLDNNMNPVDTIIVPDPLNITVESVGENNSLFKKEVVRDSAQFTLRLQQTEKIYAIGIKKSTNSDNQNSYLLITKLKSP